nr:hypothetical protein CFP56_58786 [Quercus suber]
MDAIMRAVAAKAAAQVLRSWIDETLSESCNGASTVPPLSGTRSELLPVVMYGSSHGRKVSHDNGDDAIDDQCRRQQGGIPGIGSQKSL